MDFQEMSDAKIIDLCSQGIGPGNTGAAIGEMQRRATIAIREFNAQSKEQTQALINLVREAGSQNATMIRLTRWIIALTVALGILAALQLLAMLAGVA